MCDFCTTHGEGKIWYLQAKNYSKELLLAENRIKLLTKFYQRNFPFYFPVTLIDKFDLLPPSLKKFISNLINKPINKWQKRLHWGQVVPITDIKKILSIVDTVVRLECFCRTLTIGKRERLCFGIGIDILKLIFGDSGGLGSNLEVLSPKQALQEIQKLQEQGMFHTIWTFKTPYIGAICSCDKNCLPYRLAYRCQLYTFFSGEYQAYINQEVCTVCGECAKICPFAAIIHEQGRYRVDMERCLGCGLCVSVCSRAAVEIKVSAKKNQGEEMGS